MAPKRCYGCMKTKTHSPICEHCGYDERSGNASYHLPVGTVLREQYIIGRVLGQGGFGITYLGWDAFLDIPVAIKEYYPNGMVMRDANLSLSVNRTAATDNAHFENCLTRFLREAKSLAKLRNAAEIVHVHSFFRENGTAYIVMEFIDGITLKSHVAQRGGKLSLEEVFSILRPIMEALEKVHSVGLIHRDISPDNIMLLPGGGIKLLDFGAAREIMLDSGGAVAPHTTEAILKQGYAPMEQYLRRGSLGPWTDIYALCATIYYCLTGQVPPEAPARMMEDIHPQWDQISGLTEQQRQALEKGMHLDSSARIQSAKELIQALYSVNAQQQESAPSAVVSAKPIFAAEVPPKKAQPAPKVRKKAPGRKRFIGAAMAILLLAGMAAQLLYPRKTEPNTLQTSEPAQTGYPPETAPQTTPPTEAPKDPMDYMLMPSEINISNQALCIGGFVTRPKIKTVTFLSSLDTAPEDAVDVSLRRNGNVLAWVIRDGANYHLYVAAEGGVYAPTSCRELFRDYMCATSFDFGSSFHTEYVTDMSQMFEACIAVEALDVQSFDTSSVTNMNQMFGAVHLVTSLDLSGFDTSNVTDFSYMFNQCYHLHSLDISNFDTSSATDVTGMFLITDKLTDVSGNFDFSSVTDHSRFMDPRDTINGKPWMGLFS